MASQALLGELKTIILQDYGIELTQPDLTYIGNTLVSFSDLLVKIDCRKPEEEKKQ